MELNLLNEFVNLIPGQLGTEWAPAAIETKTDLEFISAALGYVGSAQSYWIAGNYYQKSDFIPASANVVNVPELLYSASACSNPGIYQTSLCNNECIKCTSVFL